jgi:dolichyl-phosphate beta-glucosyltransferase
VNHPNVKLSVIIPAYNEATRLPDTLKETCLYLREQDYQAEVIVVDDGSRDQTVKMARTLSKTFLFVRIIESDKNYGKGHAVKTGALAALGELILFTDADNSTPIAEIEKLLPFIGKYEVVIGSRHMKDSNVVIRQPWYRRLLSRSANLVIQTLLVRGVQDTQCGFKLFQKKAARELFARQKTNGFGFDIEILTIAQKVLKYKIKEVPVSWYNSTDSRVRPIRDAFRTLRELVRITFTVHRGGYKKR